MSKHDPLWEDVVSNAPPELTFGEGRQTCGGCEKTRSCEILSMINGNSADALRRPENIYTTD